MAPFDPYLAWLDIPPNQRPVNHYRLLRLRPGEGDPQTIAAAAARIETLLRQHAQGPHAAECTRLLAEVAAARECLLDPARKQAYDAGQGTARHERQIAPPPPVPGGAPNYGPSAPRGGEQPLTGPGGGQRSEGSRIAPPPPPPGGAASGPAIPSPSPAPQSPAGGAPGGYSSGWGETKGGFPFVSAGPMAGAPATPQQPAAPIARPVAQPVQPSYTPPPPSPPPEPETASEGNRSWIPAGRTGRVGQAISKAESGELAEPRTAKAKGMRRRKRELTMAMQVTAALVIVSLTAILVLVLVLFITNM